MMSEWKRAFTIIKFAPRGLKIMNIAWIIISVVLAIPQLIIDNGSTLFVTVLLLANLPIMFLAQYCSLFYSKQLQTSAIAYEYKTSGYANFILLIHLLSITLSFIAITALTFVGKLNLQEAVWIFMIVSILCALIDLFMVFVYKFYIISFISYYLMYLIIMPFGKGIIKDGLVHLPLWVVVMTGFLVSGVLYCLVRWISTLLYKFPDDRKALGKLGEQFQ